MNRAPHPLPERNDAPITLAAAGALLLLVCFCAAFWFGVVALAVWLIG
jgi:hypothetical protein